MAAGIFAATAICSYGFHHFDEHFQILEFAGLKLGINQPSDMAWEYQAMIRPAVQPAAVVLLVKAMKAMGVTSPFTWVLIIRLLTAGFMLLAISALTSALVRRVEPDRQKLFIALSYFLYFIPYVAVRFSSETVAGGFFLLGLSILLSYIDIEGKQKWWQLPAAGLLFGLSFICRFQCGIMIAGVLIWLGFVYRMPLMRLILIAAPIAPVIGIGMLIDHWFYGVWCFTPYNYFTTNIMEGSGHQFGSSPWYYYLSELMGGDARSLIKILLLTGVSFFVLSQRRDIITFTVVPFVLAHILIAHKEMRFMIPIAFFAPYIMIVFWGYISDRVKSERGRQVMRLVLFQALFINGLSLVANVIKPADGQPLVYEYLYHRSDKKPLDIYYIHKGGNFYWGQGMLPMNFYNPIGYRLHEAHASDTSALRLLAAKGPVLVIAPMQAALSQWPLKKVFSSKPDWLQLADINDWMTIKNDDWIVYRVLPPKIKTTPTGNVQNR